VMDGKIDRVEKPFVGVRSEIHGDSSLRRNRARHLDIEHDFPVVGAAPRGVIPGVVDGDGYHVRLWNSKLLKIHSKVTVVETTSQLDDADALPGSVELYTLQFGGEFVAFREVRWRDAIIAPRPAGGADRALTEGGLLLGPRVVSEDACDDPFKLLRNKDI